MEKLSITQMIEKLAEDHWAAGGRPAEAMMAPTVARKFREEWSSVNERLLPGASGGLEILELATDFGNIRILTSPYCPPDKIYIADAGEMQRIAEETAKLYADRGWNFG